jgi:hypothetical protein
MKHQSSQLSALATAAVLSIVPLSVKAHPGHGLTEGGALHWLASADHLAVLALTGVAAWSMGIVLKNRAFRKILQYGGAAALAVAAVVWGFCA